MKLFPDGIDTACINSPYGLGKTEMLSQLAGGIERVLLISASQTYTSQVIARLNQSKFIGLTKKIEHAWNLFNNPWYSANQPDDECPFVQSNNAMRNGVQSYTAVMNGMKIPTFREVEEALERALAKLHDIHPFNVNKLCDEISDVALKWLILLQEPQQICACFGCRFVRQNGNNTGMLHREQLYMLGTLFRRTSSSIISSNRAGNGRHFSWNCWMLAKKLPLWQTAVLRKLALSKSL